MGKKIEVYFRFLLRLNVIRVEKNIFGESLHSLVGLVPLCLVLFLFCYQLPINLYSSSVYCNKKRGKKNVIQKNKIKKLP